MSSCTDTSQVARRDALEPSAVEAHFAVLEESVFQTNTRWPQFRLLLDDVRALATELSPGSDIVALERTILYGGWSLFAPLFHRQKYISVECSPPSAEQRGGYNDQMIADPRIIHIPYTLRGNECDTGLEDACADLVIVPNLVHHVADQERLFAEMRRLVRPGGQVYVFEPLLRELHQVPDDYLRYTPYGLARILEQNSFAIEKVGVEGGPFQAIAYCWEQALQYLPPAERELRGRWFWEEHFPQLLRWDDEHRHNRVREHTTFPVAFSIRARRS